MLNISLSYPPPPDQSNKVLMLTSFNILERNLCKFLYNLHYISFSLSYLSLTKKEKCASIVKQLDIRTTLFSELFKSVKLYHSRRNFQLFVTVYSECTRFCWLALCLLFTAEPVVYIYSVVVASEFISSLWAFLWRRWQRRVIGGYQLVIWGSVVNLRDKLVHWKRRG